MPWPGSGSARPPSALHGSQPSRLHPPVLLGGFVPGGPQTSGQAPSRNRGRGPRPVTESRCRCPASLQRLVCPDCSHHSSARVSVSFKRDSGHRNALRGFQTSNGSSRVGRGRRWAPRAQEGGLVGEPVPPRGGAAGHVGPTGREGSGPADRGPVPVSPFSGLQPALRRDGHACPGL